MAIHSDSRAIVIAIALFLAPSCDCSSKFLSDYGGTLSEKAFRDEIANAMGSVLGCGGAADPKHIEEVKSVILPMWRTLPKTQNTIDRRHLRYVVHRYFMQTSSLMIRGFEPTRPSNDSHWGSSDILSQMVPAYVESVLESKHNTQQGFNLQDVIDMVLTLDQLIFDSESSLLEKVWPRQSHQGTLSHKALKSVLEEYMLKWMVDATDPHHELLMNNRTLAHEVLPHLDEVNKFSEGRIKAFEYDRQQRVPKGRSSDAWSMRYTFEDAHKVVGGITRSFQAYWQAECSSMKESLMAMDKHGTGRVPLARFYDSGINVEWRFGESEEYLRELGALHESSSWIGPQVLIANYIQATSNCIVSTSHYLVCCAAECENLLGEIESAVQRPEALPSTILDIVRKMTSQTTLDHDEPPHLDGNMVSQLEKVAKSNGGMVPLHSRLFAQWLHYVFPHECPFPTKPSMGSLATPSEFGNYAASKGDMEKHASDTTALDVAITKEDLQWLSQWEADEELIMDYSPEGGSSWSLLFVIGSMLLVAGGIYGGVLQNNNNKKDTGLLQNSLHSHFV